MSSAPWLARFGADAGRAGVVEQLRAVLADGGSAAATGSPGLAAAWRGASDAEPPGSAGILCLIDGWIDGLGPLRSELRVAADDATVLALGYERFGEAVLERVRGAFAVLLWNRRTRTGIVARDQLGGRPVHYAADGRGQIVATEMRDLLGAAVLRRNPDRVALAHWLARRPPPGERTLFDGVSRLGAGGLIRLGGGHAEASRWWEPHYREPVAIDLPEAVVAVRDAMSDAVGRALDGAGDPAIMLSGGLDSACIAGLARRLGSPARAYSLVFPAHPLVDESQQIELIADAIGLDVRTLTFAGGGALAAADRYVRTWALPPSSPNLFAWEPLYAAARQDGVDVLLDGEGGDEVFGCAPLLLADLLVAGRLRELVAQARRIPGMGATPTRRRVRRTIAHYGARGALPPALHGRLRWMRNRGRPAPSWLTAEAAALLEGPPERDAWKFRSGPRWWASLAFSLVDGPDRMAAHDEAARAGGLGGFAVAHPWRDLTLVELMLSLAPQLSFDPHHDRPLAREAVRGLIPEGVRLSDRKPVFNALLDDAFAGPDAEALAALLRDPGDAIAWAVRPEGLTTVPGPARSLVGWRVATASIWARGVFG